MSLATRKQVADTPFDESLDDFREFLFGQGLSTDLIWLFSEDVIFQDEAVFIKTPHSITNEDRAKDCYELGQKRNFGISLQAFCSFQSQLCCYIYLPEDDLDAQYSLMSNEAVKYSVWNNLKEAQSISSVVKWKIMRLRNYKESNHFSSLAHIPSKFSLLPDLGEKNLTG